MVNGILMNVSIVFFFDEQRKDVSMESSENWLEMHLYPENQAYRFCFIRKNSFNINLDVIKTLLKICKLSKDETKHEKKDSWMNVVFDVFLYVLCVCVFVYLFMWFFLGIELDSIIQLINNFCSSFFFLANMLSFCKRLKWVNIPAIQFYLEEKKYQHREIIFFFQIGKFHSIFWLKKIW